MWLFAGTILSALITAYVARKNQQQQNAMTERLNQEALNAPMRQMPINPYLEQISGTTNIDPNPMAVGYLKRLTAGAEQGMANANALLGY